MSRDFRIRIAFVLLSVLVLSVAVYEYREVLEIIYRQETEFPEYDTEVVLEDSEPRNLVVVLMDTLRADRMSVYGYNRPTTPYLDSQQGEYLRFENAQSTAPWTMPSHASLFTGLLPASHQTQWGHMFLDDHYETLAESLKKEGFCNMALVANKLVKQKKFGLLQGFHYVYAPEFDPSGRILNELDNMLERTSEKKCRRFIFMNFMINHLPFETGEYAEEYGVTTDPFITADETKFEVSVGDLILSPEELEQFRSRYDASVRYSDHVYQKVIETLSAYGLFEDSLIVLLSDHGEGLGYHKELGHTMSSWEEQLHVPLMLRFPEGKHSGVFDKRVSMVDFPASILKWLNISPDADFQGEGFLMQPSAPVLSDQRKYSTELKYGLNRIFVSRYPALADDIFHQHVLYCGDYKMIARSDGSFDYYNIKTDPHESVNLVAEETESFNKCRESYSEYLRKGSFTDFNKTYSAEEREEIMERSDPELLKSLGYL